jgi:hypothetical protein
LQVSQTCITDPSAEVTLLIVSLQLKQPLSPKKDVRKTIKITTGTVSTINGTGLKLQMRDDTDASITVITGKRKYHFVK